MDVGVAEVRAAGIQGTRFDPLLPSPIRGRRERAERVLHGRCAEPAGDPGGRLPDERRRRQREALGSRRHRLRLPAHHNKILEAYLLAKGVAKEDITVNYTPFGFSDWQTRVAEIKKFGSAGKKTAVVSTINGDANVPFYKELANAGVKATDIPVMAFSVGEEELAGVDTKNLVGHLAAWNYFESIKTPANENFIADWHAFTKNPKRTTNDPMEAHYIGFNMWVKAVEKAGTTDPDKVIAALPGTTAPNLTGGVSTLLPNHHITKPVFIGESRRWPVRCRLEDERSGAGCGVVALPRRLEGSRCRLGRQEVWQLQHQDQQVRRLRPASTSCDGGALDDTRAAIIQFMRFRTDGQVRMRARRRVGLVHAASFAAALLLALFAGSPTPVRADLAALDAAVDHFLEDDYSETATGIEAVAASGEPQAAAILDALANRRLFFNKATNTVAYTDAAGAAFDARTAKPIAAAPADGVRVNNRMRGLIDAAMGSLTLRAPDASKRIQAADAIFKTHDQTVRPALEKAMAAETDPRVAAVMAQARAALVLEDKSSGVADLIDAIGVVAGRGDQDAISLLLGLNLPALAPEVASAAQHAKTAVERRLAIISAIQNIWYGLSLGSVLLLAAIGLAITFGVMGVINMAHGEMVMIGAYTTYMVQEVFNAFAPSAIGWSLLLALPAAFIVTGLIGIAIQRGIIRHLYGRPLETLLATWGVSLVLQQVIRTWFGASNVQVVSPGYMTGSLDVFGLSPEPGGCASWR